MATTTNSTDHDDDGNLTISFGCDYAKTSHARCHGKFCDNEITKGTLRLSRLIRNPFIPQSSSRVDQLMPLYYHVQCLINYLRSGSEKKKQIENVQNDFQGFDQLKSRDKERLNKLFQYEDQLKAKLTETSTTASTTYLEHDEQKKFWQISIEKKSTKTKYGLVNDQYSNDIVLYKDFSSEIEANKYYQKKIQEKLKRGYSIKKQTHHVSSSQSTIEKTLKRKSSTPSSTRRKRTKRDSTQSMIKTRTQPSRSATKKKN